MVNHCVKAAFAHSLPTALMFLSGVAWSAAVKPMQSSTPSSSDLIDSKWWITDGGVLAVLPVGNILYLGGGFTRIGPCIPFGVPIDALNGTPDTPFAEPNGGVSVSVPDGSGGWYIGGGFSLVGDTPRDHLAQIDSSGEVTGWNPGCDGGIAELVISGGTMCVGGSFSVIGGQARSNIAALDPATGQATSWNPGADDDVRAIATNRLYLHTPANGAIDGDTWDRFSLACHTGGDCAVILGWTDSRHGTGSVQIGTADEGWTILEPYDLQGSWSGKDISRLWLRFQPAGMGALPVRIGWVRLTEQEEGR